MRTQLLKHRTTRNISASLTPKHRIRQKHNASLTQIHTEKYLCGSVFRSVLFRVRKEKGFTLLELIVAVGIFAAVIAMASGLFISVLRIQRNAEQNQNVADNARSTMEIMTRAIRVSVIQVGGADCATSGNNGTSTCITAAHPTEGTITYRLSGTIIQQKTGAAGWLDVTSAQMRITRLDFRTSGVGTADSLQPRLTIVLEAEGTSTRPGEQAKLNLQTTVTQRALGL